MFSTFYPQDGEPSAMSRLINHDREADLTVEPGPGMQKRSGPTSRAYPLMFVSTVHPEARTWAEPVRTDSPIVLVQPTCRGEHARMLAIAAARRLRAVERAAVQRAEDADYWKQVAPAAIRKAADLRERAGFALLPS
jgi:hypothetical protein